jgi:uncharacterized protein (TIGR00725 family)
MSSQKPTIGVIGAGETSKENFQLAYEMGKHIAARGAILVCGGLGGIMEAASKGASENGGTIIGILPGLDKAEANPFITIAIPTGMGISRNVLVVQASDVIIAFPGAFGTLSEMAIALASGKTVIHFPGTWDLKRIGTVDVSRFKEAFDPRQAIGLALDALQTVPSTSIFE